MSELPAGKSELQTKVRRVAAGTAARMDAVRRVSFQSDRFCPIKAGTFTGMKLKHLVEDNKRLEGELIARFGEAALIRRLDGGWKLRGGSQADRCEAREWISLFLHEAVIETGR
jgi:hypothetical protein